MSKGEIQPGEPVLGSKRRRRPHIAEEYREALGPSAQAVGELVRHLRRRYQGPAQGMDPIYG